jgi:hypothetical protein
MYARDVITENGVFRGNRVEELYEGTERNTMEN